MFHRSVAAVIADPLSVNMMLAALDVRRAGHVGDVAVVGAGIRARQRLGLGHRLLAAGGSGDK
jgi:hypothetical protein